MTDGPRTLKVAFVLNTLGFLRHFERTVAVLLDRGHQVRLLVTDKNDVSRLPETLRRRKGLRVVKASLQRSGPLGNALKVLRSARDVVRYHEPAFATRDLLRSRALERLIEIVSGSSRPFDPSWGSWCAEMTGVERAQLKSAFDAIEAAVPSDPAFDRLLLSDWPDVVLVTPLITFGSILTDWVKAARRAGVPVGFPVFSWDNLSTKGTIHEAPDRVFVWNEIQKHEAVAMHGMDPSGVSVIGAPRFDQFFEMQPAEPREAFCRRLGFDPSLPILTFLGSSPMVAPNEPAFVDAWIEQVRSSGHAAVRDANVCVRPHPRCVSQWEAWRPAGARVGINASEGLNSDQALFDCLYHAAATVGLNTSAQLEAGILGKPVLTILAPAHAPGQAGTVHFEYLLAQRGGFVDVAESLDAHQGQLARILSGDFDAGRTARFIESFVRPHGLGRPVAPLLADAVEALAATSPNRPEKGFVAAVGRRLGWGRVDPTTGVATLHAEVLRATERARQAKEKARHLQIALNAAQADLAPAVLPDQDAALHTPGAADTVRVDYPHADIRILAASDPEGQWRATASATEPWTMTWLETHVQPGDVVYDIGAHIGVCSLIAASRLQGRGLVVAFESGFASYAHLCENIALNGFDALILPVPLPLGLASGLQTLTDRDRGAGQGRHPVAAKAWRPETAPGTRYTQPVLSARLDDLAGTFGLPAPVHVKLDVEGGVVDVLQGGRRTLAAPSVRTLMIEVDVDSEAEILQLLRELGFGLDARHPHAASAREMKTWCGLFARS